MKKLFLILVLCLCGFLFAEEFKVGDLSFNFSTEESTATGDYRIVNLTAVLPYENGYVIKLTAKSFVLEYFVTKGFVFYEIYNDLDEDYNYLKVIKKHTITNISQNEFKTEVTQTKIVPYD